MIEYDVVTKKCPIGPLSSWGDLLVEKIQLIGSQAIIDSAQIDGLQNSFRRLCRPSHEVSEERYAESDWWPGSFRRIVREDAEGWKIGLLIKTLSTGSQ